MTTSGTAGPLATFIIARKQQEINEKKNDEAKSFFFPPEDDEEPQELTEIAEQVQAAIELNKKIFGTPVFRHTSAFRSIDGIGTWEEWLAPARPLDASHTVDPSVINNLMNAIRNNPPSSPNEINIIEVKEE